MASAKISCLCLHETCGNSKTAATKPPLGSNALPHAACLGSLREPDWKLQDRSSDRGLWLMLLVAVTRTGAAGSIRNRVAQT